MSKVSRALPEGWKWVKLGEVCKIIGGTTPPTTVKENWGDDISWISPSDLTGYTDKIIKKGKKSLSQTGFKKHFGTLLPKGTVLFSSRAPIGHVAIAGTELVTNQGFRSLICNANLSPDYLYYWLKSQKDFINDSANGTTFKEITGTTLAKLHFPLPPLPTQQKIAAILDRADALRRTDEQLKQQYNNLAQAIFIDMFGDPVRNEKGWPMNKLEELGNLDRGKSKHRPRNAPKLYGGIYPFIQTGDVSNSEGYVSRYGQTYSELGLAQSKLWPKGTLCITIAANIAKTGILEQDSCFPDSVVGFTPNADNTTSYVMHWLGFLQKVIEEQAPAAAQKNINLEILRNLAIPKPPYSLQREFEKAIALIKESKTNINSNSGIFNSLLSRAFTGELVP